MKLDARFNWAARIIGLLAGLVVLTLVISEFDSTVFRQFLANGLWPQILILCVLAVTLSISSTSLVLSEATDVKYWRMAEATLFATSLNLVFPLSGTTSKLTILKFKHELSLKKSTKLIFSLMVLRITIGLSALAGFSTAAVFEEPLILLLLAPLAFLPARLKGMLIKKGGTFESVGRRLYLLLAFEASLYSIQVFIFFLVFEGIPASSISLIQISALVGLVTILSIIPTGFMGIGLREAGILAFLAMTGISPQVMANIVLLERTVWIIGIICSASAIYAMNRIWLGRR